MNIDPYYQQQKCTPKIAVSSYIRFCGYSRGFAWEGASATAGLSCFFFQFRPYHSAASPAPLAKASRHIAFKWPILVYKCLHRSAPSYLVNELCQVADVEARQRLRSASSSSLIVARTRLSTVGDRAFPVAAARIWNSLPQCVTSAPSLLVFWSHLKTHLFCTKYCSPLPYTVQLNTSIVLYMAVKWQ